jgi:hypothetical protein
MKQRAVRTVAIALAVSVLPAAGLSAQQLWDAGLPGEDVGFVALHFGGILPNTTLPDGASWENGGALGVSVNLWVNRYLGFRFAGLTAVTEGVHGDEYSAAAANADRVYLYNAEVALRYPIMGDRIAPFLSGGVGGKSYRWNFGLYNGGTSPTMTVAGGVDIRPEAFGVFGLLLEARYYRSDYQWHGLSWLGPLPDFDRVAPRVEDLAVTAGVSVHF